jgi:hypothetical protein
MPLSHYHPRDLVGSLSPSYQPDAADIPCHSVVTLSHGCCNIPEYYPVSQLSRCHQGVTWMSTCCCLVMLSSDWHLVVSFAPYCYPFTFCQTVKMLSPYHSVVTVSLCCHSAILLSLHQRRFPQSPGCHHLSVVAPCQPMVRLLSSCHPFTQLHPIVTLLLPCFFTCHLISIFSCWHHGFIHSTSCHHGPLLSQRIFGVTGSPACHQESWFHLVNLLSTYHPAVTFHPVDNRLSPCIQFIKLLPRCQHHVALSSSCHPVTLVWPLHPAENQTSWCHPVIQ